MVYISPERKAEIVALVKPLLKTYGIKATFSIKNHSILACNICEGNLDFADDFYMSNDPYLIKLGVAEQYKQDLHSGMYINPYHYQSHFKGKSKAFLTELVTAMNTGNYDSSVSLTVCSDVGQHIEVSIGKPKTPYRVVK